MGAAARHGAQQGANTNTNTGLGAHGLLSRLLSKSIPAAAVHGMKQGSATDQKYETSHPCRPNVAASLGLDDLGEMGDTRRRQQRQCQCAKQTTAPRPLGSLSSKNFPSQACLACLPLLALPRTWHLHCCLGRRDWSRGGEICQASPAESVCPGEHGGAEACMWRTDKANKALEHVLRG